LLEALVQLLKERMPSISIEQEEEAILLQLQEPIENTIDAYNSIDRIQERECIGVQLTLIAYMP